MAVGSSFIQTTPAVFHVPPGTDVEVGDTVTGAGIVPGTTVVTIDVVTADGGPWNGYSITSVYLSITLSQSFSTTATGVNEYNYSQITSSFTGLDYGGWSTKLSFSRLEQITQPDPIVYLPASTVSFREDVKGWVSFKSFTPDNAISCANEYYSFTSSNTAAKKGLYIHHDETVDRNTFYSNYIPSSFSVIFNTVPGSVKSFKTLNYEGSQARVLENTLSGTTYNDGEYYNLTAVDGWFVSSSITNLESGDISEFIEKEGKWYGYFTGVDANVNSLALVVGDYNTADFNVQGIGIVTRVEMLVVYGCTDPDAFNYNASAGVDDGSCAAVLEGCIDPDATNYSDLVNTDDGSCAYPGCTDPTAFNYDPNATNDDGSCIPTISGCMDMNSFNWNPNANFSDPNNDPCIAYIYGCTDAIANNYNTLANSDDGSCDYGGCMDLDACNYDANAQVDNGSCTYCGDSNAGNYDSGSCNDGCIYCQPVTGITFSDVTDTTFTLSFTPPDPNTSDATDPLIGGSGFTVLFNGMTLAAFALLHPNIFSAGVIYDPGVSWTHSYSGLTPTTGGNTQVISVSITNNCIGGNSSTTEVSAVTLPATELLGCTDSSACNYNPAANVDDVSCNYVDCVGCTDPLYDGYCGDCWNPITLQACTPGAGEADCVTFSTHDQLECGLLLTAGCTTDVNAVNYDANATAGGTCEYCYVDYSTSIGGTMDYLQSPSSFYTDDGVLTIPYEITGVYVTTPGVAAINEIHLELIDSNGAIGGQQWIFPMAGAFYDNNIETPWVWSFPFQDSLNQGTFPTTLIPNENYVVRATATCQSTDGAFTGHTVVHEQTLTTTTAVFGCMDSGFMDSSYANNQGGTGSFFIGVNANTPAFNYDPLAEFDDGSCNYALQIGDTYEGGLVWQLTPPTSGTSGLGEGRVVATGGANDMQQWGGWGRIEEPWGFSGTDLSAAVIGADGFDNTANILDLNLINTTAGIGSTMQWILNVDWEGYSDWYVPSSLEMQSMIVKLGEVATTVNSAGDSNTNIGNFEPLNSFYWTSNPQIGNNNINVHAVKIGPIGLGDVNNVLRTDSAFARAARKISYPYQV